MQHHTRSQREEQDFHDIWSSGLRRDDQNGWKRLWEYKKSPLKMIFLQLCLSRVHICNFWASEHQMILSSCCSCRRKSCIGVAWKKKKKGTLPPIISSLWIFISWRRGAGFELQITVSGPTQTVDYFTHSLRLLINATPPPKKGIQIVWECLAQSKVVRH